jgi:bifunctional non-homologous end joining protein LigD
MATAVCAYSTRARPGATISMSLSWKDLTKDPRSLYAISNVPDHLAGRGEDPWQDFEAARRPLTARLLRRLK